MQIIPNQWHQTVSKILETPKGVVFLLGGMDTGKTTFALLLAAEVAKRGIKVGIIDADVGQSTFGPPTTISFVEVPPRYEEAIGKLKPSSLYFVGNNSPRCYLLPTVVGVKKMVDKARFAGCELIIVDTTGLIVPPMGPPLKYHKIQLLRPRHIVSLERGNELRTICQSFSGYKYFKFYRLQVPSQIKTLSREERVKIRNKAYRAYFQEAKSFEVDLKRVSLYPSSANLLTRDDLLDLLVGMEDTQGDTLGLAKLSNLSPDIERVELISPFKGTGRVASLVLGCIRLNSNYEEIEKMPPWRVAKEVESFKK